MPINQISQQFNTVVMALAGADRVFKLMDEEPEVDDGYFKSASFGYDVIEDFVLISLPVYMNDDTDVKSYVEEKLKDIEELYD